MAVVLAQARLCPSTGRLRLAESRLRLAESRLRLAENRLRLVENRLRLVENRLRLAESRLRLAEGGFRLAVAELQRGEGGRGGIRTHGDLSATLALQASPFIHSGTLPIFNPTTHISNDPLPNETR